MHITYGERSNSFLLVEYGFTIKSNRYDFVRVKDVCIEDFYADWEDQDESLKSMYSQNMEKYWLKDRVRADLKLVSVHRDVLKLIRA